MSDAAIIMGKAIKPKTSTDDWIMRAMMLAIAAYLLLAIALPLYAILSKSFQDPDGMYIGLTNYITYLSTPALTWSIGNSFKVTFVATVIVLFIAFIYSYALTRSCMPFKKFFKGVALIPLLMPSLLPAIALVFFFGNQGVIKEWLFGYELYGPIGIVMGEVFFVFPHVMTILLISMSLSDARLYEASEVLGASKIRTFFTVTLPSMRYGLVSAFFVAFTLVITDFGVPKVVGGQYNVLATDVYKQVVGRHDFQMGAVVAMALLLPAAFAFIADRLVQRKQVALLSARAVPFEPKPSFTFDMVMFAFCALIALIITSVLAMAAYSSLVTFWPYNLTLTLKHYNFDLMDGGGWSSYFNSIELATYTAIFGTIVIFSGAYLVEKSRGFHKGRSIMQALCMVPMAVPGLVLGLAYVFFFNHPDNPLDFLYHSMPILVICTITHFYTVAHLSSVTALKQMDPEFEAVSQSLKAPFYKTFWRVTVPCLLYTSPSPRDRG